MALESSALGLTALYIQILGTVLFCLIFLFLWRQSGITYFGYWSVAWAVQSVALLCAYRYFKSNAALWLAPYAFLEFTFALSLLAAARAGPSGSGGTWKSTLKALLAFPIFLFLIYSLGLQSRLEAFHALHALVLGVIFTYSYFTLRGSVGTGGKMLRFASLCLAIAFLHNALVFFYLYQVGATPSWARYLQYNSLYEFALHMLLAFSAMAMWIESQNFRLQELGDELDRIRKETLTSIDVDRLTGLLNQAALAKHMDNPRGFVGVVAVCDMDNFKQVNDRYGHLVGDEVLRNIGHLLTSSIRKEDQAFRWGGDEFVILFHNQNLTVVRTRMQAIQERLQSFRVRGYGVLPISFSWGTAEAAGSALRQILDEADRDMYNFKRQRSSRAT